MKWPEVGWPQVFFSITLYLAFEERMSHLTWLSPFQSGLVSEVPAPVFRLPRWTAGCLYGGLGSKLSSTSTFLTRPAPQPRRFWNAGLSCFPSDNSCSSFNEWGKRPVRGQEFWQRHLGFNDSGLIELSGVDPSRIDEITPFAPSHCPFTVILVIADQKQFSE